MVTITVTDEDGQTATASQAIRVANVAPTITNLTASAFSEATPGTAFAAATDPAGENDPLTWTWDWGDGTAPTRGLNRTQASHIDELIEVVLQLGRELDREHRPSSLR